MYIYENSFLFYKLKTMIFTVDVIEHIKYTYRIISIVIMAGLVNMCIAL